MYTETVDKIAAVAAKKVRFFKTQGPVFFVHSVLAGIYIGLGVIILLVANAFIPASLSPAGKFLGAAAFAAALSLVVMAGAELFTGNNLIISLGALRKKISWKEAAAFWLINWLGNFLGSLIIAQLYAASGLNAEPIATAIRKTAEAKAALAFGPLFFRAVLCNLLVCLAVWCAQKMNSESGKLIMIFWCIFVFVAAGFEHSIANMTFFSLGLIEQAVTPEIALQQVLIATLGNFCGAFFLLALPYSLEKSQAPENAA